MTASTPSDRRRLFLEAIVDARKRDTTVVFRAADGLVEYSDRILHVEFEETADRESLEALLSEYPMIKIDGPETRKAEGGRVYLSAVTDPKSLVDFLESLFRVVFDAHQRYELSVSTE
ncbi:MAG: hypothetical protein PPP58_02675 [Natronomonas sp.]